MLSTSTPSPVVTSKTTSPTAGNWWDKLGAPQYGGELVYRADRDVIKWDPYLSGSTYCLLCAWLDRLIGHDWTVNPSVYNFRLGFTPDEYVKGWLAQSWEFTDSSTVTVHLRKGIQWQNISPANGREFTADDVVWNVHRMYGGGDGFTKPSPYLTGTLWQNLSSVTAIDRYTVVYKWSLSNVEIIDEIMKSPTADNSMVNPEAVKEWGDVNDWHHSIGTGAFVVNDFVTGSSLTLVKNPNYWAYDERYPQNKLPYIDTLKILVIPDASTALAALRTAKLDAYEGVTLQNVQQVQKTNPEILEMTVPAGGGLTVDPRHDVTPFKDVRVLQAMQMAIDLPTIAQTYYGGAVSSNPVTLTHPYMVGWGFPYSQWPQDLKDQFAYNPTAAKKLLSDAGYPSGFKTNCVADNTGDLDLLQIVKSYWAAIGIDMEIRAMDSTSWVTFVQNGHKQDQLAYRAAGSSCLNSEPSNQLNVFHSGIARNFMMASDPVFDSLYPAALAATSVAQVKELLRQGNEIFARQHFVISLLLPNSYILYQPWFKGFGGQLGVITGGGGGPQLIGFYTARLWVDQTLKKSMGH